MPFVPTVATDPLLLVQVPPEVASVRLVVKPAHTVAVPVTDAGTGLIVTVALPCAPHRPPADRALK